MNSFDIRQKFLDFFKKNGHKIVSSSSLIPTQDPTLLFTNAGMNQFKDIFLGKETREYKKAVTIQKCVRAGGKHNDLDEVGFTNRHLTFFEMMGNFSFGDYFKKEAIEYAWEFLTKQIKLPIESLYITVYKNDDEAFDLWNKNMNIPSSKIFRLGEKDNFWQMGETGPCGPCSEIHFDHGADKGCKKTDCSPACSCGRFTEIWNLVFMQFDRQSNGEMKQLKQRGIDTGMGLERLCMILQNKENVFQIDQFQILIKKIEEITKKSYSQSNANIKVAFHVLLDHVRSSSFLVADGCIPSNEGRGYVLRKIIRRAALFAQKLSNNTKLFSTLANEFICFMDVIYPELKENRDLIINILDKEIERFTLNLEQGQNIIEKYFEQNLKENKKYFSGEQIFKLYDTYGFPVELTKVIAKEKDFSLDLSGFEIEMKKQQELSGKKIQKDFLKIVVPENITTKFVGYEKLEHESKINFIEQIDSSLFIATEESPFYVESGGQVSDSGWIKIKEEIYPIENVIKTGSLNNPAIIIQIKSENNLVLSKIKIGDKINCIVDYYKRINIAKNHTATHMLQAALTQILGNQIKQAGSFVTDQNLRFDFNCTRALSEEEIEKVEFLVNQKIQENIKLNIFYTTLEEARESGVTAFFGEKYNPANVRVVQIPGFSAELCGGTHVDFTGIIGCFKIENESSLSSGVRRITALTGVSAIKFFQQIHNTINKLVEQFKIKSDKVIEAVEKQQDLIQKMSSEIKSLKKQNWKVQVPVWQNKVAQVNKIPFLFLELDGFDSGQLKEICQQIEIKSPGFYFVISLGQNDSINFLGYLSKKFETVLDLKNFSNFLKNKFDFKGGGNSNLIQGGGIKSKINIEQEIVKWLKEI